jgi:hypothetical protein
MSIVFGMVETSVFFFGEFSQSGAGGGGGGRGAGFLFNSPYLDKKA